MSPASRIRKRLTRFARGYMPHRRKRERERMKERERGREKVQERKKERERERNNLAIKERLE